MYTQSSLRKNFFLIADSLSVVISFYLLSQLFQTAHLINWRFLGLVTIITILSSVLSNDYSLVHRRSLRQELSYSLIFTFKLVVTSVIILFLAFILFGKTTLFSLTLKFILIQIGLQFSLVFLLRLLVRKASDNIKTEVKKVLFVTNFTTDFEMLNILEKHGYEVVAFLSKEISDLVSVPVLTNFEEVRHLLHHQPIHEVFIDRDARAAFIEEQTYFNAMGIPVSMNFGSDHLSSVRLQHLDDMTFVTTALHDSAYRYILLKRLMDILGAFLGLILTVIVAIIINPIVQKQSKGPLIFKQKRVGQNGKVFWVYKFRSMYLDAEERKKELLAQNDLDTNLMFKMDDDPRIFPFGQKIRDWSLDELPQFFNVLKGEMSLVGTRPPTLEEYQQYELHHFKRLAAKPGITGMWQVSGRSNITDFEDVVKLDLAYIKNWSIWLDIKILLKTVKVVLKREGSK